MAMTRPGNRLALLCGLMCVVFVQVVHGQEPRPTSEITYVSSEGVYIAAGREHGLMPGDTLVVHRGRDSVGAIIVRHAASRSAAAQPVADATTFKAGDRVTLPPPSPGRATVADTTPVHATPAPLVLKDAPDRQRIRGDVAFQFYGRQDLTGSGGTWIQPALRTRFTVERVLGSNTALHVRHRSRLYHRSEPVAAGKPQDEWNHRVFELALVGGSTNGRTGWGIGRVIASDVRGMGYLDGGYVVRQVGRGYRVGLAAGTVADPITSGVRLNRRKAGFFVAWETGQNRSHRFNISTALSTEYDGGTVSRDFLYLQAIYAFGTHLSWYGSTEIDLNRGWRYEQADERLTMSNAYTMLTWNISRTAGLDLAYDARRNVRLYDTREIPDSLFDQTLHRGWRGAVRWSPFAHVLLRGTGGLRLSESGVTESRYATLSARWSRFPGPRQSMWLTMSVVESGFTTGYRPMLSYRFPATRRLYVTLSGAAQIYRSSLSSTSNYYLEAVTARPVGRRFFLSATWRQYLDSQLKSAEIFGELSVRI